ncbi:MAG TPA: hypothetical protein VMB74_02700 [Streptosporangiaceae bacterium]|nr:hypothetical protein [Streptosporangiaceae bacterium]
MSKESRPQPVPSWPAVIATTLRLWVQRHLISPRPNGRPHYASYRLALAVPAIAILGALAVVLSVTQGGHTAAASQPSDPGAPGTASPAPRPSSTARAVTATSPTAGSAGLEAASASRQQAAAWVTSQVSPGVIVACDPLMCAALQQSGFPAADLSAITTTSADPFGSGLVMSTTAVRSQLGSRLATVYAPVVIASFGRGADLIQVRSTAVGTAAAYLAAVRTDVRARKFAGHELARNKNLRMTARARAALAAGRVDSRLLITLGALTHRFPLRIVSFADAGPRAAADVPLRELTVAAPSTRYLRQLLSFLRAQRPPLLPLISLRRHGRTTEVQIKFTAPSPTGLLGAGAGR